MGEGRGCRACSNRWTRAKRARPLNMWSSMTTGKSLVAILEFTDYIFQLSLFLFVGFVPKFSYRVSTGERLSQLLQQRFKGVGMRWGEETFTHLLLIRLAWVNGRFDTCFPSSPKL